MQSKMMKAVGFTAACLLACQSYTLANDKNDSRPNNSNPPAGQNAEYGTTNDAAARARVAGDMAPAASLMSRGTMSEKDFDTHFAMDASNTNMDEIAIAKVALQRASDPQVKQYAETLVRDHEQAEDQLKKLAQEKGWALPQQADPVGAAKVSEAEKKSGPEFDRYFVYGMAGDHVTAILCFRASEQLVTDPQLKQFAEQTLPTLQRHLHEAEDLANAGSAITAGAHLQGNAPITGNATPNGAGQNK